MSLSFSKEIRHTPANMQPKTVKVSLTRVCVGVLEVGGDGLKGWSGERTEQ